jgi:hypothetical protein
MLQEKFSEWEILIEIMTCFTANRAQELPGVTLLTQAISVGNVPQAYLCCGSTTMGMLS